MGRGDGPPGRVRTLLGDGFTVVVRGPAGIGKSTLMRRAVRGLPFVVGQSLDLLSDLPYHPLAHALGRSFSGLPSDVAAEVAAHLGERLLVVEDAHWSDGTTLDVLALLAARVPLVVTSRTPVPFEGAPRVAVVDVPPLDRAAADRLARRVHPTLDLQSRVRLVDVAGGNPLLLRQLASGTAVSPTLTDAVRSRVAALPAVTIEQLALLALHQAPLPRDVLTAMGAADVLAAGAMVEERDGGIALTHALLAEAVVALVDEATRRRLHRCLADACGDADAARHLLAAGEGDRAAQRAERAAGTAAPAVRAELLSLAVAARGQAATDRLRLDAAAALIAVNQPATAEAMVAPLAGGDPVAAAEAGWYRSQAAWLAGDEAGADQRCADALALVEGSGKPIETHLLVERVVQRVRTRLGDPSVIDDAERAWAAASAAGVDRAKARSLMGLALSHNGRPGWEAHFLAAADLARADGDVEEELSAMYWLISSYGFYGPILRAIDLGSELVERSERLGLHRLHHHFLGVAAVQRFGTGTAPDDLIPPVRRLLRSDPLFRNRAQVDLALAIGLLDRGDASGATEVLATGERFARNDEDRSLLCVGRAELAWAQGDRPGLAAALGELGSCTRGFFGMNAFAESAAIHLLLDDAGVVEIPSFRRDLMPIVDVVGVERAAFDAWRGGDGTTALVGFATAAAQWADRGFVRFAARAHLAAGRVARRSGARDEAAAHYGAADELACTWCLAPIRELTHRELAEPDREELRARLSARERDVLDLVATGLTTAQIAARLGVGASTVVTHVNSARVKLGAQTRMQAASMVHQ